MGRLFPPPQFGVPLSTEQMGNELPFEAIYGITPNNKYIPISIDNQGRLNTTATLIGTVTIGQIGDIDESPFVYGTTRQQVFGGVYQDTNPTLSPGEQGAVRLTEYRALHTNLRYSDGTEVLPSTEATSVSINAGIETLNSLVPSVYDYIALSYTVGNLTTAVYKNGGVGGTVVSTLTIAYDLSNNITSVTRT